MELLVWIGAAMAGVGLVIIGYCIGAALRVRKAGLPDVEMRARLQKVVIYNMVALLISALGLGMVVMGVLLA